MKLKALTNLGGGCYGGSLYVTGGMILVMLNTWDGSLMLQYVHVNPAAPTGSVMMIC